MTPKIIDLRSDTVTLPSPEMWEAIRSLNNSNLGDDVFKEDPTVNELEERAAKITGKEDALFVTSGTQGNLVSILSSTNHGDEILVEDKSHILLFEVGGAARIGGLTSRTYKSIRGQADLLELQALIRPRDDDHQAWTTLVCVENTHNKHGGAIISPSYLNELRKFADANDLRIHMDGARIFNAVVGIKHAITDFTKNVDSMMFCLSKGLSCPVGSLIVGKSDFISQARKNRKMLGGGMRQAGIIAAMGLVALEKDWINRLEEDHLNAKYLVSGLKDLDFPLKIVEPETNIIMVDLPSGIPLNKIIDRLAEEGILVLQSGNGLRLVTHYGITREDVTYFLEKFSTILKNTVSTKILN